MGQPKDGDSVLKNAPILFNRKTMGRYLTLESEQQIKNNLELLYLDANSGLDVDMIPDLKMLNCISGLATLQSCAGHKTDDYIESAHLWIWLSKELAEKFYHYAEQLAENPCLEAVRIYFYNGPPIQEIIELYFRGNERGELTRSLDFIVPFFEHLHKKPLHTYLVVPSPVIFSEFNGR